MKVAPDRREAMRSMFLASLGFLARENLSAGATAFNDDAGRVNFDGVRSRIQQAIGQGDATGVAVAVVKGGRIVWEEGFGWANQEAGIKASPHTPFSLASITKPFTATTIMTLVAEGRLALDEPANRYLSGCQLVGTDRNVEAASVRLLGAHASGLPGIFESYGSEEQRFVPSPQALLQAYGRLAYPPATVYEYSNLGFAALNAIALDLTQTELGTLMQRRVLAPLGLNNSFFGADAVRAKEAALRYDASGCLIPHYTTSTPASGGLYASAHDLARFALFNMREGAKGHGAILNKQKVKEMHRPVFTGPSGVATTFGWFRSHTTSGIPFLFKSGGDPGVANRMCFVPSKDLACVVVTNRSNGWELACSACDEVLMNYLPEWRRPVEDCDSPSKPFIATPAWRGRWQGLLEGGGANMPVNLNFESNEAATMAIGTGQAQEVTALRSEGEACTGLSTGRIDAPDTVRTGAKTLQVKLIPHGNRLLGRVFDIAGDPNIKNVRLPFVLTLSRR